MISNSSDSAFEVVDYGYDSHRNANSHSVKDSYVFPSGSKRTHTVQANINHQNNNSFGQPPQQHTQPLYTIREQNPSKEFRRDEQSNKKSKSPSNYQQHKLLERSGHNYLNSASMSESNFIAPAENKPNRMMLNNSSSMGAGILDDFLRK